MPVGRLGGRRVREPRGDCQSDANVAHRAAAALQSSCWQNTARRRRAQGAVERVEQVDFVVHAPAEVLVQGSILEYLLHINNGFNVPAANVLIEG